MPLTIGDPAPLFSGTDVLTGNTFDLAAQKGKIVVVCFSGLSWCPPCRIEAPYLQEVWHEYDQTTALPKVQFVVISAFGNESLTQFQAGLQEFNFTMPAIHDVSIIDKYFVTGVPATFVLDTDLKVCAYHGGVPSGDIKQHIIDMIMSCGAPKPNAKPPSIYEGFNNRNHWAAVVKILLGGTGDGGGIAITPGGKPIPIDPWGSLRHAEGQARRPDRARAE